LYGTEKAVARGIQFMKSGMDICFDSKAPSIVVEIDIVMAMTKLEKEEEK
jgi:hypothetical protein